MPDSGTTSILGYVSIVPKGAYSPTATYNRLNTVSYNGASYMLIVDTPTTGVTPVDGNTWMQLCSPGEGVTVSAQEVAYVSSTQGTTPPATGWQTTVPEVSAGSYLWSRITTTFSDGSTFNAYMVTRFGIDGSGAVSTVNGVSPDATGNVQLTLGSIATVDNTPTINSQNLVTSGGVFSRINAVLSSTQVKIQNGTITLPAASWTGTGPYTQTVTVAGSTAQSQINIQGNQTAIAAANSGGFAVLISNTGGTLTAYAIGTKPTVDLTLQVTIVELSGATGTIDGAPLSGTGVADGAITIPKLATKTKDYIAAVNLLDNSDFTQFIAQAGIGGTHGNDTYAGDRWILISGTVTGTVNGTGLGYSDITLNGIIAQVLTNPPTIGTPVVEMVSGTASIIYDDVAGEVRITSSGGILKNAALWPEQYADGNTPRYQAKGYAAERLECGMYFKRLGSSTGVNISGFGTITSSANKTVRLTIPVEEMRIHAVTVILEGTINVVSVGSNTTLNEVVSVSTAYRCAAGYYADFTLNNTPGGGSQFLRMAANTFICLLADLPRRN